MRALVLGLATLALSAGVASAQQAVYPRFGYAPYGYGYYGYYPGYYGYYPRYYGDYPRYYGYRRWWGGY
jgi:hypothetical protein